MVSEMYGNNDGEHENTRELILSVSHLNNYIKDIFQRDVILNSICLEGEISNFKLHPSSGHMYFTLKDEYSQINCIMFAKYNFDLSFLPANGMSVILYGSVSVYEKTGRYQMYVYKIKNAGFGLLYERFEKLKQKLCKEGIFDESHKKKIPSFPKCIAVVTSPTGAAIRDIIRIISRRNANIKITVVPTLVQGDEAAHDISVKIALADKWKKADVIIVGRGGGAFEDLTAFNEEIVARAIYKCETPIISAVGHETDFTIADFAADLRASTPSAAAEIAAPDMSDTENDIDILAKRLKNAVINKKEICQSYFELISNRHSYACFAEKLYEMSEKTNIMKNSLVKLINEKFLAKKREYCYLLNNMESISPVAIMKRGFSITKDKYGNILTNSNDAVVGDMITIELDKGKLDAVVAAKY